MVSIKILRITSSVIHALPLFILVAGIILFVCKKKQKKASIRIALVLLPLLVSICIEIYVHSSNYIWKVYGTPRIEEMQEFFRTHQKDLLILIDLITDMDMNGEDYLVYSNGRFLNDFVNISDELQIILKELEFYQDSKIIVDTEEIVIRDYSDHTIFLYLSYNLNQEPIPTSKSEWCKIVELDNGWFIEAWYVPPA